MLDVVIYEDVLLLILFTSNQNITTEGVPRRIFQNITIKSSSFQTKPNQ
jgi:hypothetical protein